MTNLLIRLFVKQAEDTDTPAVRERFGMLSGAVGIVINLVLFSGKYLAAALSGSIAILADAFNNLSDAGSSVVTLIGFRMSGKKPDHDHPFGHGRMEYLAGMIVGFVILLFAVDLGKNSIEKIISPENVSWNMLTGVILIGSILLKLLMFFFNRSLSKRISSATLKAVSWDSLSDVAATSVVLVGTIVSELFSLPLDGYLGLLVALFILYTGITSVRDTLNPILGTQPDAKLAQQIEELVLSYDEVVGVHDLIIHDYGPGRCMVSLHAEVPQTMDILAIHDIIDEIETKLTGLFGCEVVIHMDPMATEDKLTVRTRKAVADLLTEIDPSISLHDFRMVAGDGTTELVFDVVVPYQFRLSDEDVVAAIQKSVAALDENYRAAVKVDKPFYPDQGLNR
jgi:cation diffusion facilitator family transporter